VAESSGQDKEALFENKLREAFGFYDQAGSGEIGRQDFRYLVDNLNLVARMSKDEFDAFFDMVDKDG
jgi:Ca2+-binding EF-hand superfamily protein